jgi:hypothetical protein
MSLSGGSNCENGGANEAGASSYRRAVVELARIAYETWREARYGFPLLPVSIHGLEYYRKRRETARFEELPAVEREAWVAVVERLESLEYE